MHMGELKDVAVALAISLVLAGVVYGIDYMVFQSGSGAYVEKYTATLYPNGTLVEEYTYRITADGKYSMLYRVWDSPLVRGSMNEPHVELLNITVPDGCVAYVKDTHGLVWASNSEYASQIEKRAGRNEVGCYNPSRFPAGTYVVRYVFRLHPPLKYDGERYLLNLYLLGASHLIHRSVHIRVVGNGSLENLYVYPPDMAVKEDADGYVVEGSLSRDIPLRLILLYRDSAMEAYTSSVDEDLVDSARRDAEIDGLIYSVAAWSYRAAKYCVILFPAVLIAVYLIYGREKSYYVPDELPTPPYREKPWLVHYIFHRMSLGFGVDGFYATLLDMHQRGLIEIMEVTKETMRIRFVKPWKAEDEYERNIVKVLLKWSSGGVFDLDEVRQKLIEAYQSKDKDRWMEIQKDFDMLLSPPSHMLQKVLREYIWDLWGVVKFGILASVILILVQTSILFTAFYLKSFTLFGILAASFMFIQFGLLLRGGGSVFGRWRGDHYREKLQWDAFRRFLKRCAKHGDLSHNTLSEEYLPYAVALGVGVEVAEKMKKAGISVLPISDMYGITRIWYSISYSYVTSAGGGVGGVGGFGGGGAGAR